MSHYVQIAPDGTRTVVKYRKGDGLISKRLTLQNRIRWLDKQIRLRPGLPHLKKRLSDTSRQLHELNQQIDAVKDLNASQAALTAQDSVALCHPEIRHP